MCRAADDIARLASSRNGRPRTRWFCSKCSKDLASRRGSAQVMEALEACVGEASTFSRAEKMQNQIHWQTYHRLGVTWLETLRRQATGILPNRHASCFRMNLFQHVSDHMDDMLMTSRFSAVLRRGTKDHTKLASSEASGYRQQQEQDISKAFATSDAWNVFMACRADSVIS